MQLYMIHFHNIPLQVFAFSTFTFPRNEYHVIARSIMALTIQGPCQITTLESKSLHLFFFIWQLNGLIAGAVAGAAIATRTRSWSQVFGMAALVSAFSAAAEYSRSL